MGLNCDSKGFVSHLSNMTYGTHCQSLALGDTQKIASIWKPTEAFVVGKENGVYSRVSLLTVLWRADCRKQDGSRIVRKCHHNLLEK